MPAQIAPHDGRELYALDRRSSAVPLRLLPRESLSKAELAKRFGTSETPVREALLRLEEEGLVVIKPQSGTYVAPIDIERASEARFLRVSVEIEVVKQLCKSIDEDCSRSCALFCHGNASSANATIGKAFRARI